MLPTDILLPVFVHVALVTAVLLLLTLKRAQALQGRKVHELIAPGEPHPRGRYLEGGPTG